MTNLFERGGVIAIDTEPPAGFDGECVRASNDFHVVTKVLHDNAAKVFGLSAA